MTSGLSQCRPPPPVPVTCHWRNSLALHGVGCPHQYRLRVTRGTHLLFTMSAAPTSTSYESLEELTRFSQCRLPPPVPSRPSPSVPVTCHWRNSIALHRAGRLHQYRLRVTGGTHSLFIEPAVSTSTGYVSLEELNRSS
ncbi:hypothetical protein J6590_055546 [Homalodisca vitripennis]|nr:hypothetical protein J6590_055546 [Homalodisca vitripennis]